MNERIEYKVQWYDGINREWVFDCTYSTIDEAKEELERRKQLYPKENHNIIMRRVTDWCEVKEGTME